MPTPRKSDEAMAQIRSKQDAPGLRSTKKNHTSLPTQFGRYTIIDQIGSGGMGDVYRAYDPDLRRTVAVKVFRAPESTNMSDHTRSTARQQMLIEAQAMAKLSHPNIVPIYDVGSFDDGIFLAMEFISGKTLRQYIKQEIRDWKEAIRLVSQAGEGLQAVHDAGLTHRDIKPENIVVGNDGVARILDFGLAGVEEHLDDPSSEKPSIPAPESPQNDTISTAYSRVSRSISGTPGYLAPELFQGVAANPWSDQFALGVVLFESIYGHRPFSNTDLFQAHTSKDLCIELPRGGPKCLQHVLARAMSFRPEDRYPDLRTLLYEAENRMSTRRHFSIFVLSLCLLILGGVSFGTRSASNPSPCDSATEKTKGIWDAEQRSKAKAAFLKSGLRFAEDTWDKVSNLLINYREQWIESYEEICDQNQEFSQRFDFDSDRRMRCIHRRLRQFEMLSEVFANASPPVIEKATSASLQLVPPSQCQDDDLQEEEYPLPLNAGRRNKILAIQKELDRSLTLALSGKIEEATRVAKTCTERAFTAQYPPILIDALLRYSDVLSEQWHFSDAAPLQQNALTLAISIGDSNRAASTIGRLLHSLSLLQSDLSELSEQISLAKAIVQRSHASPIDRARIHNSTGNIYLNFQQTAFAKLAYLEGLEVPEIPDNVRAAILMNVAQCELETDQLEKAKRNLNTTRKILGNYYGDQHPHLTHVTALIGAVLFLQGRVRASLDFFDQAISLATNAQGEVRPQAAPAYRHRGMALQQLGHVIQAKASAETHLQLDLRLLGPDHPRLCSNYNQIAEFSGIIGDFEAERQALISLEQLTKNQPNSQFCRFLTLWSRAYYHLRRHEFDEARRQLEIAEKHWKTLLESSTVESLMKSELVRFFRRKLIEFQAELFFESGQMHLAKSKLEAAIEQQNTANPMDFAAYYLKLAIIERKLRQWDAAHAYLDRVERIFVAADGSDSRRLAEVELQRAQIAIELTHWSTAYNLLKQAESRLDDRFSSPLLLAELELDLARTSNSIATHREQAIPLAKQARNRLAGRLPVKHPRLIEIDQFLTNCCSAK